MAIISVSLSNKLLSEIDALKDEVGFSGRSEVIRAGSRMLIEDQREKRKQSGNVNSVLILIHPQKSEDRVTEIKHDFEDIVNTQIHSHLPEKQCLELFILEGDAQRIIQLDQSLNQNVKFLHSKLVTLPQD